MQITAQSVLAALAPGRFSSRTRKIAGVALLGLLVIWLAANAIELVVTPLDGFDESIQVLGARAVNSGMLPHADFWTDYPALNYWIVAGVSRITADSYMIGRFVSLAFYLLVLVVAWWSAPNRTGSWWMTVGLALSIGKFYYLPAWDAVALLLTVLLLLCWRRPQRSPAFWIGIGTLAALCLLIRVNFGIYAALVAGACLVLDAATVRRRLLNLVCLCAPMVAGVAFYCILLRGDLPAVYAQLFDFPMHGLMVQRIESIRRLSVGLFVFPLLMAGKHVVRNRREFFGYGSFAVVVAAAYLLDLQRHLGVPRPSFAIAVALSLFLLQAVTRRLENGDFTLLLAYFLCLHYYLARDDAHHMWPALLVLGMLLWKHSAQWPWSGGKWWDMASLAATGALGLFLVVNLAPALLLPSRLAFSRYSFERLADLGEEDLRQDFGLRHDGLPQALNYLFRQSSPSDPVYSGLQDHARGYTNNLGVYVLLKRPIPVSDYEYEPGWSSEEPAQRIAAAELERTRTNWLLLWKGVPPEKNSRRGSDLLDNYIRSTFCLQETFGDYQIWRRCDEVNR